MKTTSEFRMNRAAGAVGLLVLAVAGCMPGGSDRMVLRKASDALKERGYRLKIYDAYRPQSAVNHFMRWAADRTDAEMKAAFYPELDKSVLFEQGYIAAKSGHSRGSTVDLTLHAQGRALPRPLLRLPRALTEYTETVAVGIEH